MLDFLAFLGFGYFMKPRFILLLVLLTMVGGATAWRIINPHKRTEISLESLNVRAAPEFQLLDQNNRPIQLKGYVGRYRVFLYFFEASQGPDADPVLQRLREVYTVLKRSHVMVFAISSPLGPDHKPKALSYPFPILRDTLAGQKGSCTANWGRARSVSGASAPSPVEPAAFLIEANGLVSWGEGFPRPLDDPLALINAIVSGQK